MIDTFYCKEQLKMQEGVEMGKEVKDEYQGSGKSSTDSVNSGYGADYQIYIHTTWMGPLVRVRYSSLTQSGFRLDRVKSSSCDFAEKIPVDSNASCFTYFCSDNSSPENAEFCLTLH
jgi:hypothetical protein